ncbi:C-X-C motif chemokine 3-like [Protopterus annectens]|uniref:C-X-C motif chemokine 3-like n=1 Tax=Protopterus annectens TaxID=7888 RepID=UPI001CFC10FF|nr:C-X-C motif chemokine 3-like [Protopterus annectens]
MVFLKESAAVFLLILCSTCHYLDVVAGYAPTRCKCVKSTKFVPWKNINSFVVTERGPHCTRTEIVLNAKKNVIICLNPSQKQGQRLLNCWRRMVRDSDGTQKCIRKFRKRSTKTKKQAHMRKSILLRPGITRSEKFVESSNTTKTAQDHLITTRWQSETPIR